MCVLFGALWWSPPLAAARAGYLSGKVFDTNGAALQGVIVTLSGIGGPRDDESNFAGKFRFSPLDPGAYRLTAELEGYNTEELRKVLVSGGKLTQLTIMMEPYAVAETITVPEETPLLDEQAVQLAIKIERDELEEVPRQADPWSVVVQAPAVIAEVTGEGQLPRFTAVGSSSLDSKVTLDGGVALAITTPAGPAPDFSDMGALEEVGLMIGGADASTPTAGLQVKLLTRRGTNEWRGSGRYDLAPGEGRPKPGLAQPAPEGSSSGDTTPNDIDQIETFGVEGGGRLLRDYLWIWGALGYRNLDLVARGGQLDATEIESLSYKLNAQLGNSDSAFIAFKEGENRETGRGAGPRRAPEATWHQHATEDRWAAEETHLFGESFYLTASVAHAEEKLALVPLSFGDDFTAVGHEALRDSLGVWRQGFYFLDSSRSGDEYRLDVNWFRDRVSSDHEVRFGGSFERDEVVKVVAFPGSGAVSIQGENFGLASPRDVAVVTREGRSAGEVSTTGLWIQETYTRGDVTATLGLRHDRQEGENRAGIVAASPLVPDVLPALEFGGDDADDLSWADFSPRAAVTWDTGGDGTTLLRASYARFAERLRVERVLRTHPLSLASALHFFTDRDGDEALGPGELGPLFYCDGCGSGPLGSPRSPARNSRSLEGIRTDELTASIEHAFRPEFVVGLSLGYRRLCRIPEERVLVWEDGRIRVATRGDYQQDGFVTGTLPDGLHYQEPHFALRPGLRPTGGTLLTNGDREQESRSASFILFKRFAGGWMLRGQATWSEWTWQVPKAFDTFDDPTDVEAPGDNHGASAAERLSAPLGETGEWLGGRWSFDLSGLYQVAPERRWGFQLAGRIFGREGSPSPFFHRVIGTDGTVREVAVGAFDRFREDDLLIVDLRVAKDLRPDWDFLPDNWDSLLDNLEITLSLDALNLLDRTPVLARERNLALPNAGSEIESAPPRLLRFGIAVRYH